MKIIKSTFIIFALAGFISVQFGSFFDEPEHFFEPDPDCPICIATQTPICMDTVETFDFVPDSVFYIQDTVILQQYTEHISSILSIRAPPISFS